MRIGYVGGDDLKGNNENTGGSASTAAGDGGGVCDDLVVDGDGEQSLQHHMHIVKEHICCHCDG